MVTRKTPARPKAKQYYIGVDLYGTTLCNSVVADGPSDYIFTSEEQVRSTYEEAVNDGTWVGNILIAKIVGGLELVKSIEEVTPESIIEGEE